MFQPEYTNWKQKNLKFVMILLFILEFDWIICVKICLGGLGWTSRTVIRKD